MIESFAIVSWRQTFGLINKQKVIYTQRTTWLDINSSDLLQWVWEGV